ncbi:hypothetical protein JCM10212_000036 [Sporobolomyces blumeae]
MPNWHGISASIAALARPHSVQPRLVVESIAHLDWQEFKRSGIDGVVIDKDNCISRPHEDRLAPDNPRLARAWRDLVDTFGPDNVLVVSNSAGTLAKDPLLLQAGAVSRNLNVPVLVHKAPKPGTPCVRQVATHFYLRALAARSPAQPPPPVRSPSSGDEPKQSQIVYSPLARSRHRQRSTRPESVIRSIRPSPLDPIPDRSPRPAHDALRLLVIGDRLATDMILSDRLARTPLPIAPPSSSPRPSLSSLVPFRRSLASSSFTYPEEVVRAGPRRIETVGILTTGLHAKEGLGTWLMRKLETAIVRRGLAKRRRMRSETSEAQVERGLDAWEVCLKGVEGTTSGPTTTTLSPIATSTNPERETAPARLVVAPSSSSPGSTASTSRVFPLVFSTVSTVSALPTVLPHRIRTWPLHVAKSLRLVPRRVSTWLTRVVEDHVPTLLTRLHGPLDRLRVIYYEPDRIATRPSFEVPRSAATSYVERQRRAFGRAGWGAGSASREQGGGGGGGGGEGAALSAKVDRGLDRFEGIVEQARDKVKQRSSSAPSSSSSSSSSSS